MTLQITTCIQRRTKTFSKWISSAMCNTRYLLCLNSAYLKCSVSTRLLPAQWFMTCLCTLGTLYLFSTAERHWMAAGSSSRASRKLITSIAPACASPRGKALIFWAHSSKNQIHYTKSIMRSNTAQNPFILKMWREVKFLTVQWWNYTTWCFGTFI